MENDPVKEKRMARTKAQVTARMDVLIEQIEKHRRRYYRDADPIISDAEYDLLERELLELEKEYPDWVLSHSTSFRVGAGLAKDHPEREHATAMLSLGNAYNHEDLASFFKRTSEDIEASPTYSAELKIDGLSLSLIYENGSLVRAVTRGDGRVGEEVTANARTIRELPLRVPAWSEIAEMEVRGEVYIRRSSFEALNKKRLDESLPIFANPRNAAAGSLRLLDSNEVAKRSLSIFIYQAIGPWADAFGSHLDSLNALRELGFPVNPDNREIRDLASLFSLIDEWRAARAELEYETDGIVLKVDDPSLYETIGYTAKFPKWAIAYKFPAEQATSRVESIEIQVGPNRRPDPGR